METTPTNNDQIKYELVDTFENQQLYDDYNDFVYSEVDYADNIDDSLTREESSEIYTECLNHSNQLETLQRLMQSENSFAVTAVGPKGNLVGIRMLEISDTNEVEHSYIAVSLQNRRQGVASNLVIRSHEVLLSKGIVKYTIGAHSPSLSVLRKLPNVSVELIEAGQIDVGEKGMYEVELKAT